MEPTHLTPEEIAAIKAKLTQFEQTYQRNRENVRKWQAAHPGYAKQWRARNIERLRVKNNEYTERNKARINPRRNAANKARREAAKKLAEVAAVAEVADVSPAAAE